MQADLGYLPADAQNNQAIPEDDDVAGNGKSRLRSGNSTFETTDFTNPTTSLTINASNDAAGEKITVNNVDEQKALCVTLFRRHLPGNARKCGFNTGRE